jgi:hypothetical protein
MLGVMQHRFPRILVGVAVSSIAMSYWFEFFSDDLMIVVELRRGSGWLLWPSLAWTAWSGIAYSKRFAADVEAVRREHENGGT